MGIFTIDNYKDVIRSFIEKNRNIRGYQSRLAEVARCQRSHLSTVLRSHHHLSPEQALRLADYWELSDIESEYFLCLLQLEKTDSERYANWCRAQLKCLRKRSSDLSERYSAGKLQDEKKSLRYYGCWTYQAVHALLSLSRYSPDDIAKRLAIGVGEVEDTIKDLVEMGLVEPDESGYTMKASNLHLSRHSPMNWVNHHHWRNRAVDACQSKPDGGIHYSALYALSREDQETVTNLVRNLLDQSRQRAVSSCGTDVMILTCDWFPL